MGETHVVLRPIQEWPWATRPSPHISVKASRVRFRAQRAQAVDRMLLKPVLAPRQSVGRVAGHLKQELAVAPLIEELPGGWFLDWQPAEHERRGSESEILVRLLALQADAGNGPG